MTGISIAYLQFMRTVCAISPTKPLAYMISVTDSHNTMCMRNVILLRTAEFQQCRLQISEGRDLGSSQGVVTLRTRQARTEQSVSDVETRWIASYLRNESCSNMRKDFEFEILPELICANLGCDPRVGALHRWSENCGKRRIFLRGGHLRCAEKEN